MVQKLSDKTMLLLITTRTRTHTRTRIIELSTIIKRLTSTNYLRANKHQRY